MRYQMEVGKFKTEIIKSKRQTLPLFLYAISQSTNKEDVKLVMGLPKYQLDNDEYVNEIKSQYMREFKFKLDGDWRNLRVHDVILFPEGMGAYYTITNDLRDKYVILIDIGGSTFNILLFKNGEFIKAETLPFGSLNLLNDIRGKVLSLHGGRHSFDDIGDYLKRGKVDKTDDKMEYRVGMSQKYVDELLTLLDLEFPKDQADYFLSGGGVEVFSECLIKNLGDVGLICDYLHANAIGFKRIGDAFYGKNGEYKLQG
ncbi:MAG: hypothetical protein ACRDD7_15245 [Peptostreptococcaceae bacterium]